MILVCHAKWSEDSLEEDHAIRTAKIENDLVKELRIYENTEENRNKFSL